MILDEGGALRCISGRFIRLTGGFSFFGLSDVIPAASSLERALEDKDWDWVCGRKKRHTLACYHHLQARATIDDSSSPLCLLMAILSSSV